MTDIDWAAITAALQAPMDPADIDFRPQGEAYERNGEHNGRVLAYIDARAVMHRLDTVVGAQYWHGCPDPLIMDNAVRVVRYALTIHGVTKYAIGDAGATEPSKSADSDGLKRAAVLWGIGRDLYNLESEWVKAVPMKNKRGEDSWRIADGEVDRLRKKLAAMRAQAQRQTAQAAEQPQEPRNRPQATPTTPPPANGARPSAGAGSESATPGASTPAQHARIRDLVGPAGLTVDALLQTQGLTTLADFTEAKAKRIIERLEAKIAANAPDPNSPVADTPRLTAVR